MYTTQRSIIYTEHLFRDIVHPHKAKHEILLITSPLDCTDQLHDWNSYAVVSCFRTSDREMSSVGMYVSFFVLRLT